MPGEDETIVNDAFVRATVEQRIRALCKGSCKYCGGSYGAPSDRYGEWDDLASWIFGYCRNRCRLAAGEPSELDIDAAIAVLYPQPS
jgi:hypothetical protein